MNIESGKTAHRLGSLIPNPKLKLREQFHEVMRVFRQMSEAKVPGNTMEDLKTECEQLTSEVCVAGLVEGVGHQEADAGQSGGEAMVHPRCVASDRAGCS